MIKFVPYIIFCTFMPFIIGRAAGMYSTGLMEAFIVGIPLILASSFVGALITKDMWDREYLTS